MNGCVVPPGGLAWRPALSGNQVIWDGEAVVKSFHARLDAYAREHALLTRFGTAPTTLPVPRLLPTRRFGELRYPYLEGVPAGMAIEAGLAPQVLAEMGKFLRRLHGLDAFPFADVLPGGGSVVVHGDFAPYNVLVNGDSGALVAVLDWEESHRGERTLDLAWCEAQLLARHPHSAGALRHFHAAYGEAPNRAQREQTLERRFAELHARVVPAPRNASSEPPSEAVLYRCTFARRAEAAAFVAALSRLLAGPAATAARPPSGASNNLVWAAPASEDGAQDLYLTENVLRDTRAGFGEPPVVTAVTLAQVPAECQLLYGAGDIPAWGVDEARRHLPTTRA